MKYLWLTTFLLMPLAAIAATPTQGMWNRDAVGTTGPILPAATYTNKKTIPSGGVVTMVCPAGTAQFSTASADGSNYEVRVNGNGAACPTGNVTDGSAGEPRPNARTWISTTTDLTFCGVSGTVVYLSCWKFK